MNTAPQPTKPEMQALKSSNLKSIGYDAGAREVHVEFHSGATWIYEDIPPELYEKLRQHESPGSFFHRNIKATRAGRKA